MVLAAISFFCIMSDNDDDDDDDDDDDKEYGCLFTCLSFIFALYPIGGKLLGLLHIPDLILKLYGFNLFSNGLFPLRRAKWCPV
jgi:hypothetical protein